MEVPDPLPAGSPPGVPRFDANPERLRVETSTLTGSVRAERDEQRRPGQCGRTARLPVRTYTILTDPASPPTATTPNMTVSAVRIGDCRRVHRGVVQHGALLRYRERCRQRQRRRADADSVQQPAEQGVAGNPPRPAVAGHRRRRGGREPDDVAGGCRPRSTPTPSPQASPIRAIRRISSKATTSAASTAAFSSRPRASPSSTSPSSARRRPTWNRAAASRSLNDRPPLVLRASDQLGRPSAVRRHRDRQSPAIAARASTIRRTAIGCGPSVGRRPSTWRT